MRDECRGGTMVRRGIMPGRAMLTFHYLKLGNNNRIWREMVGGAIGGRHRGYRAGSGNYRGEMSVSLADGLVVLLWHDAICASRGLTRKCLGFHSDTLSNSFLIHVRSVDAHITCMCDGATCQVGQLSRWDECLSRRWFSRAVVARRHMCE